MKQILFTFSLFFFLLSNGNSQYFEFSPVATDAYNKILSLEIQSAKEKIKELKNQEPNNLIVHHLENYIDFFTIYIGENKDEFSTLEKNKQKRLSAIESGDINSPYYLYLQANIRLHWALARLKFEEYFTAFLEVNKAFKLLTENSKRFPDFLPNKKDLGILHAMVGTIPDNYRWGVKLLTNLDGTIAQGRAEIEEVIEHSNNNDFVYDIETRAMYAYMLLHLQNDEHSAWQMLQNDNINLSTNLLACFTLANVAMRTKKNDVAINILENRPRSNQYMPFPYLEFMLGVAKLRNLDKSSENHFKLFLKNYSGRNFIKEAYQKLAWNALIWEGPDNYKKYMEYCSISGYEIVGSDKSAQFESESNSIPNVILLKSRLLFDGGYYEKAIAALNDLDTSKIGSSKEQLEYIYRKGRIFHKLEKVDVALAHYDNTIELGQNEKYYFACNAALQAGLLCEQYQKWNLAKFYFQKCLQISPGEHKTALHQQAKAGILRLKN